MEAPYLQLIGGEWREAIGGGTRDVVDPATEEVVAVVPFGDRADAEAAIDAAHAALPSWAESTPYARAKVLKKAAEAMRARAKELGPVTSRECGKPLAQAKGEWYVAADFFEWYAEEAKRCYGRVVPSARPGKRQVVIQQPIGVVGVITAWNFPAYNPSRSWAAALAAGCAVVARPSEETPLTAMHMAQVLTEAGLPAGVLNLVNGEPAPMGEAMMERPECRKVAFTGSVRVGRILMDQASRTFTRLSLELGGNAPVLVLPDADVEAVAKAAVAAKFRNAGQVCVSPQRFLVAPDQAPELAEVAAAAAQEIALGPGTDPASQMGPMITDAHRERVEALLAGTTEAGARVLTGGGRPEQPEKGWFLEPTVLADVGPGMPLFEEEAFGPVLPVTAYEDLDQAIALANQTPYGLAAYVWTDDYKAAVRCAERLEFGMVGINEWTPQGVEVPFPGWKQSGLGLESGAEGLQGYLETKVVGLGGLR
jgi:acyl-CoA reductase-like NAD-dependent aldehyde dehydrogenase